MSRRWALGGALLGGFVALVTQAPASWAAQGLAAASEGRLLLADARGTLWRGDAALVLTGGPGSRDAARLPGRAQWRLGWQDGAAALQLRLDGGGELPLQLRRVAGAWQVQPPSRTEPLLRLPAAWLSGLGTPWNTLQPAGQLRLSTRDFALRREAGQWRPQGELTLELDGLRSRLSPLEALGSYRLQLQAQGGEARLQLSTLDGALRLQGEGGWRAGGRTSFRGEARAAPGREAALNNLLNIIGRRQGERSLITIG